MSRIGAEAEAVVAGVTADAEQKRQALEHAQRDFDTLAAQMTRRGQKVIERIIRHGFVDRDDVKALRAGDAHCRRALAVLNVAKEQIDE